MIEQQVAAHAVRRGLPRVRGGEPWPPPLEAATGPGLPKVADNAAVAPVEIAPSRPAVSRPVRTGLPRPGAVPAVQAFGTGQSPPQQQDVHATADIPDAAVIPNRLPSPPLAQPAPDAKKPVPQNRVVRALIAGGALLWAAVVFVVVVRWFLSLNFMQDFLARYPGTTVLPQSAPVGLPVWLEWQHFLSAFFIVLIIRTGLQIHTEKRPTVFWSPRWSKDSKHKISLTLFFHQFLDLLWVANGAIFVVLLFATGQWMRVVPTSWGIIPNALSAVLQYASMNWPTEDGWTNYNSIQLLSYFVTVFVAAPLAIATGVRMSGLWPKKARRLSRIYPLELARSFHFPVMIYFVLFTIVHVTLVFATGALRNLNHMFGGQDAVNWVGFGIFCASLVVIIGACIAARPFVIAPIARLFGTVRR